MTSSACPISVLGTLSAERLGGVEVDRELVFRRLLKWPIAGVFPRAERGRRRMRHGELEHRRAHYRDFVRTQNNLAKL